MVVEVVVEEVVVEGGKEGRGGNAMWGRGARARIYIAMPPSWRQKSDR